MCCRDPSDKMFDTLKWGRFKDVLFVCERTVWRAQRFSSAHNWSRRTNIPQTCVPAPGGLVRYCTQRIVVMKTHSCVPYVCFLGWPSFPLSKERKKEFCNKFCGQTRFPSQIGSRHCAAALPLQAPISCTDIDLTLLYILIIEKYTKFAQTNKMLGLGIGILQPYSKAGRSFAASRSRLNYYRAIGSFQHKRIR